MKQVSTSSWRIIYGFLGRLAYAAALPLLSLYGRHSRPRVRVLLVNEGQVLLVKNWFGRQRWTLPGGGVHGAETEPEALVREVHEELGWQLTPEDLTLLCQVTLRPEQAPFAVNIYSGKIVAQEDNNALPPLRLQHRELIAAAWFSLDQLPALMSAEIRQVCLEYASENKKGLSQRRNLTLG